MEIKELRVGSWIFDEDGILCKINGFQPYGHSVRCDEEEGCLVLIDLYPQDESVRRGYECNLNSVKPIPLTEEVLLRCGAKEVQAKRGVLKEFVLKTVRIEMSNSGNFYYKHSKTDLQYLHRLQNLFHSLRNEELTYNHSPSI